MALHGTKQGLLQVCYSFWYHPPSRGKEITPSLPVEPRILLVMVCLLPLHPGGWRGKDTCSVTGPNLKPTRATAISIPGRGHKPIPAEQIIATGEFSVEFSRLTPNYTIKNISSKDFQQKNFSSPYLGDVSPLFFFFWLCTYYRIQGKGLKLPKEHVRIHFNYSSAKEVLNSIHCFQSLFRYLKTLLWSY